jgi:glutathione S-transferase
MSRFLDLATSLAASAAEQGRGIATTAAGRQPKELLELYDIENCPFCRLVREAMTDLDLDVLVFPCPKNGVRYRPLVERLGGKQQFPFLFDPNTDTALYESADIIAYLYQTYGSKPAPRRWLVRSLRTAASMSASLLRSGLGLHARDATDPDQTLVLYSFEASPFARRVRETLCEMEIPYEIRQMGRTRLEDWMPPPLREQLRPDYHPEQRNRRQLLASTGRVAVPCLEDPNTGARLFESSSIIDYLHDQYS